MKYKTISDLFDVINAQNFGDVLERPTIRFTRSNRLDGSHNGLLLQFNPAAVNGIAQAKELLFHEMLHDYIDSHIAWPDTGEHGILFRFYYRELITDDIHGDTDYV